MMIAFDPEAFDSYPRVLKSLEDYLVAVELKDGTARDVFIRQIFDEALFVEEADGVGNGTGAQRFIHFDTIQVVFVY